MTLNQTSDEALSSLTPESDLLERTTLNPSDWMVLARKLEHSRNALIRTLERIIDDMDGSGDEIGAKQERAHLRGILSENTPSHAVSMEEAANKEELLVKKLREAIKDRNPFEAYDLLHGIFGRQ